MQSKQHRAEVQLTPDMIEKGPDSRMRLKGRWLMRCRGKGGVVKWERPWDNLVTNEGLDLILDTYFGSTAKGTLYVGLKGEGSPAAGDTMSSHAGWSEVTAYDEAARQTATFGSASSQAIDNSGTTADFTIATDSTTVNGAFLTTDSTKGGTTGVLISAGDFASPETADDGDTLEVTVEYSLADDGA